VASESESSSRILGVAEELAQRRGFNGFSYGDIAERLSITKASLHYHFPSKADLGQALIARYRQSFDAALHAIVRESPDARRRLRRYADLYCNVLVDDRMCLCGMFAAEYSTLPETMQTDLKAFFDANERWLSRVLDAGRRDGTLAFHGTPKERAHLLLGTLEGAMLVARAYDGVKRFRTVARRALADIAAP